MLERVKFFLMMPFRVIKNICYKIKVDREYKKRIKEMKKKDPFIYK